jgi:hypothetical protein|tara:strand:+ start:445 stop:1044 length:600 start_codon:yes stop_codon:yes gene_type:complete
MRIFEDISFTDEQLQPIVNWCQSNIEFSPVVTKFNKNNQWTAVSVRGYAGTIEQIGKGGVLGTLDDLNKLQNTPLYDELMMDKILDKIPAEKERVRLMKLEAGTIIAKHTDKVDKDIKSGRIVRLHVPVITNKNVKMFSWLSGGLAEFHMAKGECWWLDVSLPHKVENNSETDRVHLVVDIYNNDTIKERYFNELCNDR